MERVFRRVGDEPNVLAARTRLLRRDGDRPLKAGCGGEGSVAREREPAGAIVSGQRMPGTTGVEPRHRVKEHDPGAVRIVRSGDVDLGHIAEAYGQRDLARGNGRLVAQALARANPKRRGLRHRRQGLRCSRTVLGQPLPPYGVRAVGDDGTVVVANRLARERAAGSLVGQKAVGSLPAALARNMSGKRRAKGAQIAPMPFSGRPMMCRWRQMRVSSACRATLVIVAFSRRSRLHISASEPPPGTVSRAVGHSGGCSRRRQGTTSASSVCSMRPAADRVSPPPRAARAYRAVCPPGLAGIRAVCPAAHGREGACPFHARPACTPWCYRQKPDRPSRRRGGLVTLAKCPDVLSSQTAPARPAPGSCAPVRRRAAFALSPVRSKRHEPHIARSAAAAGKRSG